MSALVTFPGKPSGDRSGIPSNLDAERALLGCLLYDNAVFERLGDSLKAAHFHEPFHARMFAAIESHVRKGQLAEPMLLAEQFSRDPAFDELGGIRYLADLVDRAPAGANAPDYARVIFDLARRRDLIRIGGELIDTATHPSDGATSGDILEETEQSLYSLAETGATSQGFQTATEYLTGAVTMAAAAFSRDGSLSGLSTGLADLDDTDWNGTWPTSRVIGDTEMPARWISSTAEHDILNTRRRVGLIECWYREPTNERTGEGAGSTDRVRMTMRVAIFTRYDMLLDLPSPYKHNRFKFIPIFGHRRGKDGLPYGIIRRVRDIQDGVNKRASKALFMLSTNQVIADEGAVENVEIARQEIDMPDGWVTKKQGKELRIQRDTDAATGQIQMMSLDAQTIQRVSGVNNENLGRQTNAVSGEAIKARQLQGSVGTTEPFDNLR